MKQAPILLAFLILISLAGASVAFARQATVITIRGQATVGTAGGAPLPENLPVELQIVSVNQGLLQTLSAAGDTSGGFVFQNVPRFGPDVFYTVSAFYGGLKQYSLPFSAEEADFVELRLFESTDRLDDVAIVQGTMQIDFTDVRQVGLKILLELQLFNFGDRIVYSRRSDASGAVQPVAFHFELPVGAYGIAPQMESDPANQRFTVEEGPIPVVYDSQPIIPDWPTPTIIRVSYLLPYFSGAVIDQVFPAALRNFSVWTPEDTIQVAGEQFQRIENRTAENGAIYRVYQQTGTLPANRNLIFTLEGIPTRTVRGSTSGAADENSGLTMLIIVTGLALALAVAGTGYWVRHTRRSALATLVANQSAPPGDDNLDEA